MKTKNAKETEEHNNNKTKYEAEEGKQNEEEET
jgi:hypothetical protein